MEDNRNPDLRATPPDTLGRVLSSGLLRRRRLLGTELYLVRGDSMRPSFEPGELLLVSRAAYRGTAPCRGDVVVLRDPRDAARRVMKRVVGLPGESIRIDDAALFVDGDELKEPYLGGLPSSSGLEEMAWDLQDGQYVVLGDNRARSTDSRSFGPVGEWCILGRAWFRLWPARAWGRV